MNSASRRATLGAHLARTSGAPSDFARSAPIAVCRFLRRRDRCAESDDTSVRTARTVAVPRVPPPDSSSGVACISCRSLWPPRQSARAECTTVGLTSRLTRRAGRPLASAGKRPGITRSSVESTGGRPVRADSVTVPASRSASLVRRPLKARQQDVVSPGTWTVMLCQRA